MCLLILKDLLSSFWCMSVVFSHPQVNVVKNISGLPVNFSWKVTLSKLNTAWGRGGKCSLCVIC